MIRVPALTALAALALGSPALAGRPVIGGGIQITLSRPNLPSPGVFQSGSRSHCSGFGSGWSIGNGACRPTVGCRPAIDCRTDCGYWRNGCWYAYGPQYGGLPVVGTVDRETVDSVAITDVAAPPPPDPALVDLRAGRYDRAAAEFLRRHKHAVRAEASEDSDAVVDRTDLRMAAIALAGAGDFADSAATFAEAYRDDPDPIAPPIDIDRLLGSPLESMRIVQNAVRFAHRVKTPEAWDMVGRLMAAEGRHDRARAMVARAVALRVAPSTE